MAVWAGLRAEAGFCDSLAVPLQLILDPPRSAGPILLGMPFAEAVERLRAMPGYREPSPGVRPNPGFAHYESELSISVGPDVRGFVEAVEVYRAERDVTVLFGDVAVFDLPISDVILALQSLTTVEIEDGGFTVVAPELLLAFGWSGDPDDPFFESVLVARPGYYDGPPAEVPSPPVELPRDDQPPLF